MTPPKDFWERAIKAILSAKLISEVDFDGAASRAYYVAYGGSTMTKRATGRHSEERSDEESCLDWIAG